MQRYAGRRPVRDLHRTIASRATALGGANDAPPGVAKPHPRHAGRPRTRAEPRMAGAAWVAAPGARPPAAIYFV